ncbi:MAG: FapA family protein [Desulfuromusa sp.]|nr:FapA family protein [Desulfuromusa sp.]
MSRTEEMLNSQNAVDPNLLFIEENARYKLSFRLENGQMECLAEIEIFPDVIPQTEKSLPTGEDEFVDLNDENEKQEVVPVAVIENSEPIITPPDLLWFLQKNSIIQTIDYPAVYDFCATIELGMTPPETVLARGVEPISGADGWFDLTVKISGKGADFKEDEKGNIDLKSLNAYSEIEPDQKLGIVHPPQEGTPGINVLGLPIPAEPGRLFELVAGEGAILKYDDRVAFAEKAGRALLEKQIISVVDQLVVPGDVDLNIGDIDFHGFVEVKGDVPDDFDIKASKGIKVSGAVGACHLESAGSVEIASMAGKEIGRIVCHGDLHANYLNQVTVVCFGDVYVTNEIRNSVIKSTGKVIIERGSIIGGRCTAMDGIETKDLGTSSGLKTRVVAGVYFPDADRFDYLREQLLSINRQIQSINEAIEPLKRYLQKNGSIVSSAEKRLSILNEQLIKLQQEKKHFNAEIAASTPQEFDSKNPKINILKALREGVFITLGKATEEIKIERTGPMSIIENTRDGGLRYLTLTPMQVMATQIEEELLTEEIDPFDAENETDQ